MRTFPAFFVVALLLVASARAQDPSDPAAPSAPAREQDLPLIPETPATREKPRGTALPEAPVTTKKKEKKTSTDSTALEIAERIRFREAKTKALRDPAIQAQWELAQRARTDYEKREALKVYYKLLYGRIAKLDASLKKQVATRQLASLRRLEQTRIDPTEPLDPDERAVRFSRE